MLEDHHRKLALIRGQRQVKRRRIHAMLNAASLHRQPLNVVARLPPCASRGKDIRVCQSTDCLHAHYREDLRRSYTVQRHGSIYLQRARERDERTRPRTKWHTENTVFVEERLTRVERSSCQITRASGYLCKCPCKRKVPVPDDQRAGRSCSPRIFSQVLVIFPGEARGGHRPALWSLRNRREDARSPRSVGGA